MTFRCPIKQEEKTLKPDGEVAEHVGVLSRLQDTLFDGTYILKS